MHVSFSQPSGYNRSILRAAHTLTYTHRSLYTRGLCRSIAAYGADKTILYDNFANVRRFRNANTARTVVPGVDLLGMNVGGFSSSLKICIASCQLTRFLLGERWRSALYPPPLLVKSELRRRCS